MCGREYKAEVFAVYSRLRRPRAEGRHDGLAAARGEARQQPRMALLTKKIIWAIMNEKAHLFSPGIRS